VLYELAGCNVDMWSGNFAMNCVSVNVNIDLYSL